jgi:outer membrane usher protein FimD/PapC
MTLTPEGGALHRINGSGSTRLLVDTDGVADVPVRGYGSNIRTNRFGKAVITDISSYYRNSARIDIDKIGDNAEAINSVVQATLTEGAIGYRRFNVISGAKAMAIIKLADGSVPPFSAKVVNARGQTTGLINDDGSVYLSGIKAGETMNVEWDGKAQCEIRIPIPLPTDAAGHQLLLPCETSGDTP